MKRILLEAVILFGLFSGPQAADIVVTSIQTIQGVNPISTDNIIVASGGILQISGNWHAADNVTTCNKVYIREGGKIQFLGNSRLNVNGLALGGQSTAPWGDVNGGSWSMGMGDTLQIMTGGNPWSEAEGEEIHVEGANALVHIDGVASKTKAVILNPIAGTTAIQFCVVDAASAITIKFCKFRGVYADTDYMGGFRLGTASAVRGSNSDTTIVDNCFFDSSGFVPYCSGKRFNFDTLIFYTSQFGGGERTAGIAFPPESTSDTLWRCKITHDNKNTGGDGATAIFILASHTVIYGTTISGINQSAGVLGWGYGIGYPGFDLHGLVFRGDTVSGCRFALDIWGNPYQCAVDSCKIFNNANGHEAVLFRNGNDSAWNFSNSLFYNNGNADIMINSASGVTRKKNMRFLYNTFDRSGGGIYFQNRGGSVDTLTDLYAVGNIISGNNGTGVNQTDGATVTWWRDFKYNAFDHIDTSGGSVCRIQNAAYELADSNIYKNYDSYGFVDSTSGDYRLASGSKMISAGDSAYGCLSYFSGGCGMNHFNIGYWQTFAGLGCCTVPGDFNDNGLVDLLDIIGAINFLYKAGLPPPCREKADANADGNINGRDVFYLVNFSYKNGPSPRCPFP